MVGEGDLLLNTNTDIYNNYYNTTTITTTTLTTIFSTTTTLLYQTQMDVDSKAVGIISEQQLQRHQQ